MNIQMGRIDGSEAIKAVGFSGQKNQKGMLRVRLTDGKELDYPDVSYKMYRRFVCAESKGEFYNTFIRGK